MILLLGASGYVGKAFASELRRRGQSFIPLTRRAFDYTRFDFLFDYLRTMRPLFLINAAGYSGAASEAGADVEREKSMAANALLPQMIARVCLMTKTPWGHVSSGCIYTGGKIVENGRATIERDLTGPEWTRRFEEKPADFCGFNEQDEPNFSFRFPPCNFYSGAKALAEEAIRDIGQSYIWRMRLPFNERDEPCNLLSRASSTGLRGVNSFTHLEDGVKACLDLWEMRAEFGIYNVVNPGFLPAERLADHLQRATKNARFEFIRPAVMPETDTGAPRSNCILDVAKLQKAGVRIRPVAEAVHDAFDRLNIALRGVRFAETPPPQRGPAWIPTAAI